jgi:hypothetical protein
MGFFRNIKKTAILVKDIARGVNQTVWGGAEGVQKTSEIVKSGLSGADIVIGTSHALEDIACGDVVCATVDVLGNISSAVGMVLGNLSPTKKYTKITGSITVCCRTVRWYCKNYGTFWGCTVVGGASEILGKGASFVIHQGIPKP